MHEISMVPVCLPEQPSFRAAPRVPILPVAHAGIPKPAETCSQQTLATVASQGRPGQRTRMITAHAMAAGRAPQRAYSWPTGPSLTGWHGPGPKKHGPNPVRPVTDRASAVPVPGLGPCLGRNLGPRH